MNTLYLIGAGQLIERGWTRGTDHEAGAYCAVGAILAQPASAEECYLLCLAVLAQAPKRNLGRGPVPYLTLEAFNDDPQTTKADVLAAFSRAIAVATIVRSLDLRAEIFA